MLRLIVSAPDADGARNHKTFDFNAPPLEEWLAGQPLMATVRLEAVEVVPGRARKARKKEAPGAAPIPCPYERFLAVFHEELVRWTPPAGSKELPANLAPIPNRYGAVWIKRKRLMDAMWLRIFTERRSDGSVRATTEDEALTWLRAYFRRARRSDWMMGRSNPDRGPVTFDYLVAERAWDKVVNDPRTAA